MSLVEMVTVLPLFIGLLEARVRIGFHYDPSDAEQARAAEFMYVASEKISLRDPGVPDGLTYSGFLGDSSVKLITTNQSLCTEISSIDYLISAVTAPSHVETLSDLVTRSTVPVVHMAAGKVDAAPTPTVLHPANVMVQGMQAALTDWGVQRVALVYDGADVLADVVRSQFDIGASGMIETEIQEPFGIEVLKSASKANLITMLERAATAEVKDVVIAAKSKNAGALFRALSPQVQAQFNFYLVTTDTTPFTCDDCEHANLIWFRPHPTLRKLSAGTNKQTALKEVLHYYVKRTDFLEMEYELYQGLLAEIANWCWFDGSTNTQTSSYTCGDPGSVSSVASNDFVRKYYSHESHLEHPYGAIKQDGSAFYQDMIVRAVKFQNEPNNRHLRKIGTWTKTAGYTELFPRDTDLFTITDYLVVTTKNSVPIFVDATNASNKDRFPDFNYKQDMQDSSVYYRGYCIDLIERLRVSWDKEDKAAGNFKQLSEMEGDFTYSIYEAPDGYFGGLNDRMEWNGMVQELITGEADIILTSLSITADREQVIDFSAPMYDQVGLQVMVRSKTEAEDLFRFLYVLEPEVWLCIVAAYFVTSLLMYFFDRYSPYSLSNNRAKYEHEHNERDFTLNECLWFCLTSLTPQGGGEGPKNSSSRLVAATWWLFGFIIVASYTANLAAFLTVSQLDKTVNSLDELAAQTSIQYSTGRGQASESYFRKLRDVEEELFSVWTEKSLNVSLSPRKRASLAIWDYPITEKYKKIWKSMLETGLTESDEDAVQRVLNSGEGDGGKKYAYVGDATLVRFSSTIAQCNLKAVGKEFHKLPYAIGVQEHSRLRNYFTNGVLKLLNDRELGVMRNEWWSPATNPHSVQSSCVQENTSEGISVWNIGGVYIVVIIGLVAGLIALLMEFLYYRGKREIIRVASAVGTRQPVKREAWSASSRTEAVAPVEVE